MKIINLDKHLPAKPAGPSWKTGFFGRQASVATQEKLCLMSLFSQLDALLSSDEDEYFEGDWFLEAEEQIALIGKVDLSLLLGAWKVRDISWRDRFAQASGQIKHHVLVALLQESLKESIEPSTIFGLMHRLPRQADDSKLCDALVEYSAKVWREQTLDPVQIQMGTWSCGLSGRILHRLGLKSWKEAGL